MDGERCKYCKYCDNGKLNKGQWYCNSPKVSIFQLPIDTKRCYEPKKQKGE